MAKLQRITALAQAMEHDLIRDYANWTAFLRTAAWNYKYDFQDQLLIYAQRPDATACASMEDWNTKVGRWVNKRAKGIALFDDTGEELKLRLVFDVADTNGGRQNYYRPLYLWSMRDRYEAEVITMLENTYGGLDEKESLPYALLSAAHNVVEDSVGDYLDELLPCCEDSLLEGLGDLNVGVLLREALENASAYMLLTRCGYNADEYFTREDFEGIVNFNTPATIARLGTAISDVSESMLREIGATVKYLYQEEKQSLYTFADRGGLGDNIDKEPERSAEHERTDLHPGGRLSNSRSDANARGGAADWQIWDVAKNIPQKSQEEPVRGAAVGGPPQQSSGGNRPDGQGADRPDHGAVGGTERSDRSAESQRPDEVDGIDEQSQAYGGGNGADGAGLQLTLPSVQEQQEKIAQAEDEKSSAFSIPASQEEIDYALTVWQGSENSRLRIALYFEEGHTANEKAQFVKREYGTMGGSHTLLDGSAGMFWSDDKGIAVTRGTGPDFRISWQKVQKRIGELMAAGRYLNEAEQDAMPAFRADMEAQRQQAAGETRIERPESPIYGYSEGTTVFIGTQKYTVDTIADDSIILRDQAFPLFTKTYSIEQFEEILRENPLNDPLIVPEPEKPIDYSAVQARLKDYVASEELIEYAVEVLKKGGEPSPAPEKIAEQIEAFMAEDKASLIDELEPKRTIGDIYNEYEPVIISRVICDEAYLKAREGFQDEAAARKECTEAIKRAVSDLGRKNSELAQVYRETPEFVRRLRAQVFKRTYTDFVKMSRRIERIGKPQKTTAHRNYDFLMWLAPEILTGEARYLRFEAGASFMPLTVERIGENRLAIAHTYKQDGDLMADPDMEFVFDREAGTLSARTYQQDGLSLFQQVENSAGQINTRLEKDLNSFARQWFSNIKGQNYHRTSMKVVFQNLELEARYEPSGHIIAFHGWNQDEQPHVEWMAAVRAYAQAHDVHYDVGYGYLGNGLTVYNRLEEVRHDYKTIAHISPEGEISVYADLPDYMTAELERVAADERQNWLEQQAQIESMTPAAGSPAALPAEKEKRTLVELYREYLPVIVKEVCGGPLYPYLRDKDVDILDAERELREEVDRLVLSHREDAPEFYQAYVSKTETEFRSWFLEDVLDQTYQDVSSPQDQITIHADDPNAPEWVRAIGSVTVTRQGDSFTIDRAGSAGGSYVEFDMELPDTEQEPAVKLPQPVSIEERLEQVLKAVSGCKGYEAFSADVKNLLFSKNGDSLVGFTADSWLKKIAATPEAELREYVEQYQKGTLDAYSAIREQFTPQESEVKIGQEIELDGRRFAVDAINGEEISLRDLTFQGSAGFPIFRSESLDFIRRSLEKQAEKKEKPLAPNQHVEQIDGQEFVFTTISPQEPEQLAFEESTAEKPEFHTERKHVHHSGVFFPGEIVLEKLKTGPEKHNYRLPADRPEATGAKTRYHLNVDAIRVLKQVEAENRLATPEEQETLSQYVGWGGIPQAFDGGNPEWQKEYAELKELLTEDEYTSARGSTLNAHYTTPVVIQAIYDTVARMGFKNGNILEPACGTGRFFGMLPEAMQKSKLYGVELDSLTGRISRQLYQDAHIAVQGYEDTELPDSFFDVAVGNVPFGGYGVTDQRYEKQHWLIHDYFFGKTLDKVRPGGIIAFVTSKGTMDKRDGAVRRYIAQRAELLGAVRLPNNAFLKSAGTEVTADILFLQKRDGPEDVEPEWIHLSETEDGIPINAYYAQHPEMVLGTMDYDKSMYGDSTDTACRPIEGADLAAQLAEATAHIQAEITEYDLDDLAEQEDASIPADPDVRNYSYTLVNGEIYYRENSRMNKTEVPKTTESRIRGMIALRDCVRSLIDMQTEDYSDEAIAREQARLNRLYDDYTRKYGLINSRGNQRPAGSRLVAGGRGTGFHV